MELAELATLIVLVCGRGYSDKTLDCRDLMVNCAVQANGVIKEENVSKCVERAKEIK